MAVLLLAPLLLLLLVVVLLLLLLLELLFDERNIGKKVCPEELFVDSFAGTGAGVALAAAADVGGFVGDVCGTVGVDEAEEDEVSVEFALPSALGSVVPLLPLLADSRRLSASFERNSSSMA